MTIGTLPPMRHGAEQDAALFEARRAFNRGFQPLQTWFDAQVYLPADEVWQEFNAHLGAAFESQSEGIWRCCGHPAQRAALARLFCEVAWAKMQLDPHGDPTVDATEARLWSAALASSPRAVLAWEARHLEERGELGFGFGSAKHRLADLLRRAGRTDGAALRLYIEVFAGRGALPPSGWSGQNRVALLIERGAALSPGSSEQEVAERYSLCLLLWQRGWSAPWVARSLQIARERAPQARRRWKEQCAQVEARRRKLACRPAMEQLVATLHKVALRRAEMDEARQQDEASVKQLQETAAPTLVAATILEVTSAVSEVADQSAPPKRKRGRPRKKAASALALPLSEEAVPTSPAPSQSALTPIAPITVPAKTATDPFLDFGALFDEERPSPVKPPSAPQTREAPSEWSAFDFGDEKHG